MSTSLQTTSGASTRQRHLVRKDASSSLSGRSHGDKRLLVSCPMASPDRPRCEDSLVAWFPPRTRNPHADERPPSRAPSAAGLLPGRGPLCLHSGPAEPTHPRRPRPARLPTGGRPAPRGSRDGFPTGSRSRGRRTSKRQGWRGNSPGLVDVGFVTKPPTRLSGCSSPRPHALCSGRRTPRDAPCPARPSLGPREDVTEWDVPVWRPECGTLAGFS